VECTLEYIVSTHNRHKVVAALLSLCNCTDHSDYFIQGSANGLASSCSSVFAPEAVAEYAGCCTTLGVRRLQMKPTQRHTTLTDASRCVFAPEAVAEHASECDAPEVLQVLHASMAAVQCAAQRSSSRVHASPALQEHRMYRVPDQYRGVYSNSVMTCNQPMIEQARKQTKQEHISQAQTQKRNLTELGSLHRCTHLALLLLLYVQLELCQLA
jgi:hypothetical protein